MAQKAFIIGCDGLRLSARERSFIRNERPCGLILFERNCESPEQVKALIDAVKDSINNERLLVLIDQEGGRIQRLRPPAWRQTPSMRAVGTYYKAHPGQGVAAARKVGRLLAHDLLALGINVNCTPVLDVPASGAHDIIGDRAFSSDLDTVITMGRAIAEGHLSGGVLPVIKHVPGHGRAGKDSHKELPVIDANMVDLENIDFAAFRALNDMPLAMTAHVLLPALDPDHPVSTSAKLISEIIRGKIGFDGLLMSDDISMGALSGEVANRGKAVLKAGCDVILHCNGDFGEMTALAAAAPELSGQSLARLDKAYATRGAIEPFNMEQTLEVLEDIEHLYRERVPG